MRQSHSVSPSFVQPPVQPGVFNTRAVDTTFKKYVRAA